MIRPQRPKVLLSAGMIQEGKSGIGRYVVELARRLSSEDSIDLYIAGFRSDRDLLPMTNDTHWVVIPDSYRTGVKNIIWHQLLLPRILKKNGFNLLHIPSYRRILFRSPIPQVVTIHDCAPFRLRDKYGFLRGIFGRMIAPWFAKRCAHILTVSEFTKADIVKFYKIPAERIEVIYNGLDHSKLYPREDEELQQFRKLQGLKNRFFLYISRLEHPGKNHIMLIEGFERFIDSTGLQMNLVLGGAPWHGSDVIIDRVARSSHRDKIQLPGFIEERDLPLWYASAEALIFPSLIEGFGLPVAEAMASGTLVISSDRGSLPEVGGASPIYFNPDSVDSLLVALQTFSNETEATRASRIEDGYTQARHFDWNLAAKSTCIAYNSYLSS